MILMFHLSQSSAIVVFIIMAYYVTTLYSPCTYLELYGRYIGVVTCLDHMQLHFNIKAAFKRSTTNVVLNVTGVLGAFWLQQFVR